MTVGFEVVKTGSSCMALAAGLITRSGSCETMSNGLPGIEAKKSDDGWERRVIVIASISLLCPRIFPRHTSARVLSFNFIYLVKI